MRRRARGSPEPGLPRRAWHHQPPEMDASAIRPGLRVLSNDGAMLGWVTRVEGGTMTVARSRRSELAFDVSEEHVVARLKDELFLDRPRVSYADMYRIEPGTRTTMRRLLPGGQFLRRLLPVWRHGAGSP